MATAKPLPLLNAYLIRVYLQRFDAATNTYIPATGEDFTDNVTAFFTADAAGETLINGLEDFALVELSTSENPDNAGWYTVTVPATGLNVLNTTQYLGQVIYRWIYVNADERAQFAQPLRVTLPVA